MSAKLLTEHHLEFLSLKGGCRGSSEPTLVKMISCRGSNNDTRRELLPSNAWPSVPKFISIMASRRCPANPKIHLRKKSNFQAVIFALMFVTMNGHIYIY